MNLGPYVICYILALTVIVARALMVSAAQDMSEDHYAGMPMPAPIYPRQLIHVVLAFFVGIGGPIYILSAIDSAMRNNLPITW